MEPCPRREHGADGIEKGAEIPLPQKARQEQLAPGEHGRVIQHPRHTFQPRPVPRFHGKDDALGHLVGAAEGQLNPMAGLQLHSLRDAVGIGLVNGKHSRADCYFSNHKPSGHSAMT